ncbi:MAG: RagB/SusD family nutrient uptake outer membrane protein [Lewinellaceae bacterium]|nr:RagB/SusD family nutrient uptake outer membrane protein [Lewinellaceae bacterium]
MTDKTALRNAIWHERRVELGMEQHRWFDLLRQGRVDQVMAKLKPKFTAGKNELFLFRNQKLT